MGQLAANAQLRPAIREDVAAIHALVEAQSRRGLILPRSEQEIEQGIADWMVAVVDGRVLGCGSLRRYSESLSELRSLVVDPAHRRQGLGLALIEALARQAESRRIETLFALTRAEGLFRRAGFRESRRDFFPEKIWHDCALCPIQERCDEVAMVLTVNGKADLSPLERDGATARRRA